jgi:RHS repeat-associated protein
MPQRSFASGGYRFGFNGKEKDDEVKGKGNSYDFGARIYDPRLGRWLSLDPLQAKYPNLSPYQFTGNNPIKFVDFDGKDYGVYVNHKTKKIIIKATLYHTANDTRRSQEAACHWNNVKDYEYKVFDESGNVTATYNVKYEIATKEASMPELAAGNDKEGNAFQVHPDESKRFKDNPGAEGVTLLGKYAYSKASYDGRKDELQLDAHEVGHLLTSGYKVSKDPHTSIEGDLLNTSLEGGGLDVGKSTVQNTLKTAGIGGKNSPKVTDDPRRRPQNVNVYHEGNKPKNFEHGNVKRSPKAKF